MRLGKTADCTGWGQVSASAAWNQTRTDATHIPLPPEQAAHLLLAQNRGDIRFEVLNYEYF